MSGTFLKHGALVESTRTTATAGGTTTLVATSDTVQQFTGSAAQTVQLPNATGMSIGRRFKVLNRSTGLITTKYNDGSTTVSTVPTNTQAEYTLIDNSTSNGTWDAAASSSGASSSDSAMIIQAYCFADSTGTPVGCSNPTVVGGKTRVVLGNTYPVAVTPGFTNGALRVLINGQKIPRYVDATLTPNASYTEVNSSTIDLDRDYSGFNYSIEIYQEISVVDTSTQNTNDIMAIKGHKFKNLIINSAFDFWQRVVGATTSLTGTSAVSGYTADRWRYSGSIAGGIHFSIQRSTTVPTAAQSGFASQYSYLVTSTGINTPVSAESIVPFEYRVEGSDFQTIHQRQVTLSFWVRASATGIYSVAFQNSAKDRSYVTNFTVSASNTWEFKSITVTLDASGTWLLTNGLGLSIIINAYAGATLRTSTVDAWQAGNFITSSTAANFYGSNGPTMYLAQVSLVQGTGVGATGFIRAGDNISDELEMCQRYYEKSYDVDVPLGDLTGANTGTFLYSSGSSDANPLMYIAIDTFRTTKRARPAMYSYSANSSVTGGPFGKIDIAGAGSLTIRQENIAFQDISTRSFAFHSNGGPDDIANFLEFHWTADAEL